MPKKYEPTEEQRKFITLMAIGGITKEVMARVMGIDRKTLDKAYKEELDANVPKAHAKIVGALYNAALKGNVTAMIFYLKTRLGWQEVNRLEHTGEDGGAINVNINLTPKDSKK